MNYGVLYPLALAMLPLGIAVLVYVYRKRGVGKRVLAPTTFLLKELKQSSRARKVFTPPPRFIFELALLVLLAAAMAGLFKRGPAHHIALLIDNSFSMGQVSAGQTASGNALTLAIEQGRDLLAALGENDKVDIFVAAPRLRALNDAPLGLRAAMSLLGGIELAFSADRLELAIPQLLSRADVDRTVVLSDRTLDSSIPQKSSFFQFHSLQPAPAQSPNVAISDVQFIGNGTGLRVGIHAYSPDLTPVSVSLFGLSAQNAEPFSKIEQKSVVVPKQGQVEVEFSALPAGVEAFQVRLSLERSVATPLTDAIAADNIAWVSRGLEKRKILLVSDLAPAALGLDRLPSIQVDHRVPDSSTQLIKSADWTAYAGVIFHHVAPASIPPINSLFILPPDSGLFSSRALTGESPVTSWEGNHPLLSYLNMPTLKFSNARILLAPLWSRELIRAKEGAVALAGERSGFRYVVLGFDVLPFEGGKAPFLSILFLNAIKYIADSNITGGSTGVGLPLAGLNAQTGVEFIGESGQPERKAVSTSGEFFAQRPGLYRAPGGAWNAVNYFSQEESDTFDRRTLTFSFSQRSAEQESSRIDLTSSLTLAALLVLFVDFLLLLWRRRAALKGAA